MPVPRNTRTRSRGTVDEGSGYRTPRERNDQVYPIPQNEMPMKAQKRQRQFFREHAPEFAEEKPGLPKAQRLGKSGPAGGWKWGGDI